MRTWPFFGCSDRFGEVEQPATANTIMIDDCTRSPLFVAVVRPLPCVREITACYIYMRQSSWGLRLLIRTGPGSFRQKSTFQPLFHDLFACHAPRPAVH